MDKKIQIDLPLIQGESFNIVFSQGSRPLDVEILKPFLEQWFQLVQPTCFSVYFRPKKYKKIQKNQSVDFVIKQIKIFQKERVLAKNPIPPLFSFEIKDGAIGTSLSSFSFRVEVWSSRPSVISLFISNSSGKVIKSEIEQLWIKLINDLNAPYAFSTPSIQYDFLPRNTIGNLEGFIYRELWRDHRNTLFDLSGGSRDSGQIFTTFQRQLLREDLFQELDQDSLRELIRSASIYYSKQENGHEIGVTSEANLEDYQKLHTLLSPLYGHYLSSLNNIVPYPDKAMWVNRYSYSSDQLSEIRHEIDKAIDQDYYKRWNNKFTYNIQMLDSFEDFQKMYTEYNPHLSKYFS